MDGRRVRRRARARADHRCGSSRRRQLGNRRRRCKPRGMVSARLAPQRRGTRPLLRRRQALTPHCQLGKQCRPGRSDGLTCEAGRPRVTVRDRSSPGLMARRTAVLSALTPVSWSSPRPGRSLATMLTSTDGRRAFMRGPLRLSRLGPFRYVSCTNPCTNLVHGLSSASSSGGARCGSRQRA